MTTEKGSSSGKNSKEVEKKCPPPNLTKVIAIPVKEENLENFYQVQELIADIVLLSRKRGRPKKESEEK